MNYLKYYCKLIRKAENRTLLKGYTEKHHTFPVSIFGKNKRIVVLTAREHYIVHALLEKICIKRYGLQHWKTKKMTNAHIYMKGKSRYCNSVLYGAARVRLSNSKTGIPRSEETKAKISNSRKGKKYNTLTEEHKEKIRLSKVGKPITQETKDKISKIREEKNLNRFYVVTRPNGTEFITNNLKKTCIENNLVQRNMASILNPNHHAKTHRGWKVRYCDSPQTGTI